MLDKFTAAAVNLLKNVVVLTILFCFVVGLILFAKANPEAWQALVTKAASVAVRLATWLLDQADQLIPEAE